jgi:hypothetical protein
LWVWYESNMPHGPYFIWQVSFLNFLFYFFGFNLFDLILFLKWKLVIFIVITRLTSTYVIECCNILFLVSSDLVNYCILKRLLVRRRLHMKKLREVDEKVNNLLSYVSSFCVCFLYTIFDFVSL